MTDRPTGVLVYDFKLPNRLESYEIFEASVRRNDDVAFVCDCLMPKHVQGTALRHYSFPDRWWAANVSIDLDGSLIAELGPDRAFTYDCDITTPHFEAFGALCNIDLKLDVFLPADARSHVLTDEDDFARAVDAGWIDDHDRAGAETGLAELLALIEAGDLVSFLEEICPLTSVHDAAEVQIRSVVTPSDVPVLDHWRSVRESV